MASPGSLGFDGSMSASCRERISRQTLKLILYGCNEMPAPGEPGERAPGRGVRLVRIASDAATPATTARASHTGRRGILVGKPLDGAHAFGKSFEQRLAPAARPVRCRLLIGHLVGLREKGHGRFLGRQKLLDGNQELDLASRIPLLNREIMHLLQLLRYIGLRETPLFHCANLKEPIIWCRGAPHGRPRSQACGTGWRHNCRSRATRRRASSNSTTVPAAPGIPAVPGHSTWTA